MLTSESEAITLQAPQELNSSLAVPLQSWLRSHQMYQDLVISAFIFAYRSRPSASAEHGAATDISNINNRQPYLLLIQRAEEDTFPYFWEIPGGSVEQTDPTILDAVAREVLEETGLRLTRLVEQIGEGLLMRSRRSVPFLRLAFEIEVAEIPACMHAHASSGHREADGSDSGTDHDIPVKLNPEEHQNYEWVTEDDLINGKETGKYTFVSERLYRVLLDGFARHKARFERSCSRREVAEDRKAEQ